MSSVTQTTATERESLCQRLQEKDQLQREQQDRIKNLTKLLVTASNVAIVPKVTSSLDLATVGKTMRLMVVFICKGTQEESDVGWEAAETGSSRQ